VGPAPASRPAGADRVVHVAGTGSFALEIAQYARDCGLEVAALVELRDPARVGTEVHGLPVVAADAPRAGAAGAVVGSGGDRRALWALLAPHGWRPVTLVHPAAHVSASARVGDGCVVGPAAVVGAATVLGDHALVARGALVGHHVAVGAGAVVAAGAVVVRPVAAGVRVMGIPARPVPVRPVPARPVPAREHAGEARP